MITLKLYKRILTLSIISLLFIQCSDDETVNLGDKPVADFSIPSTTVEIGSEVTFTDVSSGEPSLWTWRFAGGNPTYSNQQNPVVRYDAGGTFSVTLTVRNEAGADEIVRTDYIEVVAPPIPWLSVYNFNSELVDEGNNGIAAVSNYGDVVYTDDKGGNANKAWLGPQVNNSGLSVPAFKGIGTNAKRTVMAWFKLDEGATSRNTIISWGSNSEGKMFNVMIDGGVPRVEGGACSLKTSDTGLNDGQWHHMAVTYDPADGDKVQNIKVYIDGRLSSNLADAAGQSYRSEAVVVNTDNSVNDVQIGYAIYSNTGYYFKGAIDDVRILDDVLIEEQIAGIVAGTE